MAENVSHSADQAIIIDGNQFIKHADHWYADGNIVLLVEGTAFRLFRGVLGKRSGVMKDMLEMPQPIGQSQKGLAGADSTPDKFDGVPVVQLADEVDDFSYLLDVILPHRCLADFISAETGWNRLIGLAKLARKYEIDDIAERTFAILEKVLPTQRQTDLNRHIYDDPQAAVKVVNWARCCDLPQYLPIPLYRLATLEWKDANAATSICLSQLPLPDQIRIQRGLSLLQADVIEMAVGRWENLASDRAKPGEHCPDGDPECWTGCGDKLWAHRTNGARWTNLLRHPLEELKERGSLSTLRYLCPDCRVVFTTANRSMRGVIAERLSSYFTLADEQTESSTV